MRLYKMGNDIFERLAGLKAVVLGDVMLDSYLWGKVDRISPEAPVPVVLVKRREKRLGGAANVALNIANLGAEVFLCSVVGNDKESGEFLELLAENGISGKGIVSSKHRPTTVKHRIIAGSQQLLRVDSETSETIDELEENRLYKKIKKALSKSDVLIIQDYDKGVLSPDLISKTLKAAKKMGVPVAVDPKKKNFLTYKGVDFFKPNLKELKEGLKIDGDIDDQAALYKAVLKLKKKAGIKNVMITLSEKGVFITDFKQNLHIDAHKREIADVSGAGDTVVSVAALLFALGEPLETIAQISNLAGGIVCESLGVVPINKEKLLSEYRRCISTEHP